MVALSHIELAVQPNIVDTLRVGDPDTRITSVSELLKPRAPRPGMCICSTYLYITFSPSPTG